MLKYITIESRQWTFSKFYQAESFQVLKVEKNINSLISRLNETRQNNMPDLNRLLIRYDCKCQFLAKKEI